MRRRAALTLSVVLALLVGAVPVATQTGTLAPIAQYTFLDNDGDVCAGCLLYTYAAGTSTLLATYSDQALATPHTNPIVLNASGRIPTGGIYLSPTSYKFALHSALDVLIWTQDAVGAVPATSVSLDVEGTAGEALTAGEVVYLSAGDGGRTAGRWYLGDADNTYSSSTAAMLGVAAADISSGASGTIRLQGRITGLAALTVGVQYYISATAGAVTSSAPGNARVIGVADTVSSLVVAPNQTSPGGDLAVSGNLTVGGTSTFADAAIFSVDGVIRRNTSDGSDSGQVLLNGGGGSARDRGSFISINGNEHATLPGHVRLHTGDVANSRIIFLDSANTSMFEQLGGTGAVTFTSGSSNPFIINGTNATTGGNFQIQSSGATVIQVGSQRQLSGAGSATAGTIRAETWPTTASAANTFIADGGIMARSTSSARYKTDIDDLGNWRWFLSLRPVRFQSLTAPQGRTYGGFTAEDVARWSPRGEDGTPLFAGLDAQGRPDDVAYAHLIAVAQQGLAEHDATLRDILNAIRDLALENAALKARVRDLEGR